VKSDAMSKCSRCNRSNDVIPPIREFLLGSPSVIRGVWKFTLKPAHPSSSTSRDITCRPYSITLLQQCNTQRKMTRHTINKSNDYCNTTNSVYNVWKNGSDAGDRSQILTWLSPLEPRTRHQEVQERRVDDVGEWLIQTEEFRRWCGLGGESEGDNPVLFCYGDPGVGKTFIR